MPRYRLYFLSRRNGSIERFEEFEANDDDDALATIEPRIGDQPLELWSGGRKVGQFETALALSGMVSDGHWMPHRPERSPESRPLFDSWS